MKKLFKYNHETLQFEKIKQGSYMKLGGWLIIGLIILFIAGWLSGTNKYIINHFVNKTEVVDTVVVEGTPFSEDAFIELLKEVNVKYPYIVLAQAKIESGNYTSEIFKGNHNLFGMKQARKRTTTAIGTKNGHAYYTSWISSVYDYAMYQNNVMCDVQSEDGYYAKLGESYATDSTYATVIKNTVDNLKLKKQFDE